MSNNNDENNHQKHISFKGKVYKKRRNSRIITKLLKDKISKEFEIPTINDFYNLVNKYKRDLKDNEIIIQYLYHLQPFSSNLSLCLENSKEDCIRRFIYDYKNEKFKKNKIIYKYGDEADKFYIIQEGKVDLIFPYYEILELNIDEYYSYLLKLRRFNEIEMLNNVILLNDKAYLEAIDKSFTFDDWIKTAYNTLIQILLHPHFLKENVLTKKKKDDYNPKEKNNNFTDNNKTFENQEIKESILRIQKEIILTIQYCFPEIFKEIIEEKNGLREKKIINKLNFEIILNINKEIDIITTKEYIERISPLISPNNYLKKRKLKIMKYLYINTLQKGEHFGDIQQDYMHIFSYDEVERSKKNIVNFNLHKYDFFRNMTVISTEETYLGFINKKTYFFSLKRFSDKFNSFRSNFLLENLLFKGMINENLLKTYSLCFREKKIKQGEELICQGNILNFNNLKIFFIINGEFQSKCLKSIQQIDETLKNIGFENKINKTFPQELKGIIGTHYYNLILKKIVALKLNYVSKNDIVGLSEIFDNAYFNDVVCKSLFGNVYEVNYCIIKLLINNDSQVKKNRNIILNNKYILLSDILLTQRKIYFNCFFEKEKYKIFDEKKNEVEKNNNVNNNLRQRKIILSPNKFFKMTSESVDSLKRNEGESLLTSLGDLDIMLGNIKSKFTLSDYRERKKIEFLKKYNRKQLCQNLYKNQKSKNTISSKIEREFCLSKSLKQLMPRIKIKDNIDKRNYINLQYNLKKSNSEKNINPLIYDTFLRTYNTSYYFSIFFNKKRSISQNNTFDFNIDVNSIKINTSNKKYKSNNNKNFLITQKLRRIYTGKIHRMLNKFNDK